MKLHKTVVAAASIASVATANIAYAHPPVPISHPAPAKRMVFDTRKFMPISEVRPGMRGYALTVFKGTKIEKFDVEILGVVSKFNMGKDYILFRALNGPSVARGLNIAHGMSGSPIYVDGRLLGAISMGIPGILGAPSFPKEPMALATPIEEMFDAWSPDLPKNPAPVSASPDTMSANEQSKLSRSALSQFSQLDLPVVVSGVNRQGVKRLADELAPYHLDVFAGGGAGASTAQNPLAKNPNLNPGASVGVALAQGDVDVTAIGTVTYRDGNRLLIFGHPLADLGPIDAALTTSYVVDVYPSYQDSVKIGAPIRTVGRIFQDRPFSVGGVIGPMPEMIPITVDVNDLSFKKQKMYHTKVINHPLLTARLIEMVADQAISQIHGEPGDSMATVKMDIDAEEVGHIVRTNTFYDAQSIDQTALGDLSSALQLLSANPFYPLSVKSVKLSVTIQTRHDTAEIDHIFLKQSKFAPGDTIDVGVVLKPFKQPLTTHIVQVKIPADAPMGMVELQVKGGAAEAGGGAISIGGLVLLRPSTDQQSFATNVEQIIKEFNKKPRNNEIVAHLLLPTRALSVKGEKLSNLPPTIVSAMQSNRTTGLHTERDEVKVEQPTKYIISGSQSLSITVAKKEVVEPAHGTPATPAPSPQPAPPTTTGSEALSTDDSDTLLMSTGQELEHPADALSSGNAGPVTKASYATPADGAHSMPAPPPPPAAALPSTASPATAPAIPAPPAPTVTVQGSSAQKPVGRVASMWLQSSAADFLAGKLRNTAVSSTGGIVLSRPLTKLAETNANYAWSIASGPDDTVYVGTGDNGTIYKMDASGKLTVFYQTGELEVTSLATDANGTVYAGTIPNGVVFRITPDGRGAKWYTTPEKYVTALAYDRAGKRLFVATGGGTAKVYALSDTPTSPKAQTWLTTSEAHILSLAVDPTGVLYSGTAPNGLVYRTDLKGQSKVFYEGTEANISGLAIGDNDLYVGSSPKGTIVRVSQNDESKTVYDGAGRAVTALGAIGSRVYATAGNSVLRIAPGDNVETYLASTDEQFVSLGASGNGSAVYIGTGNGGAVYQIGGNGKAETGTFDSALYDAGGPARWGALTWRALTPAGAQVAVQTRSGDVAPPDTSWSDWSPAYQNAHGSAVTSPAARYIQYRATLTAAQDGDDNQPRLDAVSVYYLTRNEPPAVHVVSPKNGDAVSKSVNIQWTAVDPDHDTLTYDIAISGDGGKTWKPLKKRWRPVPAAPAPTVAPPAKPADHAAPSPVAPKTTSAASEADVQRQVDAMRVDLNQHPELPAAVRAQILAQAPTVIKKTEVPGTPASADTGATNLKETSFTWDSTEVPDGTYQIQVTASDRPSEPENPLKGEAASGVFTVDNTPPKITTEAPVVDADKTVSIHGSVTSGLVFVKAVQFQVDGGDTMAAAADDGLFDSPSESFKLTTLPLTSGTHKIDITAYDWAGNTTQTTVSVTVP